MTVSESSPSPKGQPSARRYLRPPEPLFFPVTVELDEAVPESGWHQRARTLLADSLQREFGDSALVTCDQFLYWDPTNPKLCLAPDVAIRRGVAREVVPSWKTWERGAPQVGIELLSASDQPVYRLEEKLARYRQAGVGEVVVFDRDQSKRPIRIWDLVGGDLVERDLTGPDALRCDALDGYWCAHMDLELGPVLRLARDAGGSCWSPPSPRQSAARESALKPSVTPLEPSATPLKPTATPLEPSATPCWTASRRSKPSSAPPAPESKRARAPVTSRRARRCRTRVARARGAFP